MFEQRTEIISRVQALSSVARGDPGFELLSWQSCNISSFGVKIVDGGATSPAISTVVTTKYRSLQ